MPGSELRTATAWQTVSRFYRRPPGRGWWLALAAVPLLIALIGHDVTDRPVAGRPGPTPAGPAVLTAPAGPALSAPAEPEAAPQQPPISAPKRAVAPMAVLRNGNVVTLNGEIPDDIARAALLAKLTGVFGPQVRLVDNLSITAGVAAPDVAGIAALCKAGINVADLKFQLGRDTLTLSGTARAAGEKAAVEAVARSTWPRATIRNEIQVPGQP